VLEPEGGSWVIGEGKCLSKDEITDVFANTQVMFLFLLMDKIMNGYIFDTILLPIKWDI